MQQTWVGVTSLWMADVGVADLGRPLGLPLRRESLPPLPVPGAPVVPRGANHGTPEGCHPLGSWVAGPETCGGECVVEGSRRLSVCRRV